MENLEHGKTYHIYNRGVNHCNLFYIRDNYEYFLRLYEKYIDPVSETYAWVLLKNHFHLLVRIKNDYEINLNRLPVPVKAVPGFQPKLKGPHLYFSDLFNAYSQALNKQQGRTGSLFEGPFRRIAVDNPVYFRNLVVYIHKNPEIHRFTDDFKDYPWSSYGTILSLKPRNAQQEKVIGWFTGEGEFIDQHAKTLDFTFINDFILE